MAMSAGEMTEGSAGAMGVAHLLIELGDVLLGAVLDRHDCLVDTDLGSVWIWRCCSR